MKIKNTEDGPALLLNSTEKKNLQKTIGILDKILDLYDNGEIDDTISADTASIAKTQLSDLLESQSQSPTG